MKLKRTLWSTQDLAQLMQMRLTHNARQIAETFGRTEHAVLQKLGKLKVKSLPIRKWSESEEFVMRGMFFRGAHAADVAKVLGRTVMSVRNRLFSNGLTRRKHVCPVGTETLLKCGLKIRKISSTGPASDRWKRVDIIEWEEIHGPIPKEYTLMIINNYLPRTLQNLRLIRKDEIWEAITGSHLPPEVRELVQLKRRIEKEAKKQKQK
ncbi:hypothetical protein M2375_000896 [Comamonas sp. BIGb0152]|uniref:hypothetical protein n=1 Tax=Comamonas sp. BIGb0152 TaxID=2940601 RepID=UPI0021677EE3|nr:hypothetical protein [Comamonas sp. BIGb0152]MCS4292690.1 hypothetical protein [Comamonas sp. BIGb0152]